MKIPSFILVLCLSVFSCNATARAMGNEGPEGGDEIGLSFRILAQEILHEIRADLPEIANKIPLAAMINGLDAVKVIVVDHPLFVERNGVRQDSVAVNFAASNTVLINRPRWMALFLEEEKRALVLHEILSLQGLESTGNYSVSSLYLLARNSQSLKNARNNFNCHDPEAGSYSLAIREQKFFAKYIAISEGSKNILKMWARNIGAKAPENVVGVQVSQDILNPLTGQKFCLWNEQKLFSFGCEGNRNTTVEVIYKTSDWSENLSGIVSYYRGDVFPRTIARSPKIQFALEMKPIHGNEEHALVIDVSPPRCK